MTGRRYLRCGWGGLQVGFLWNPDPLIQIRWYYDKYNLGAGKNARWVRLWMTPAAVEGTYGGKDDGGDPVSVPLTRLSPPPKMVELLSVARDCAARKCPPILLAGWMEDNWEHPWSLLAAPDPIALIRTLCPIPLMEKSCG